jgi:bifunctional non-homologous end joining protein LigD
VKVRFARRQEFVVGGYKPSDPYFDAILVGYYEGRRLVYASKVRAGFTPHTRAEVHAAMARAPADRCPFANLPTERRGHWGEGIAPEDMASMAWVRPRVVVEVAFTEWTREGGLRHAAFAGLRHDKRARDVVREKSA